MNLNTNLIGLDLYFLIYETLKKKLNYPTIFEKFHHKILSIAKEKKIRAQGYSFYPMFQEC